MNLMMHEAPMEGLEPHKYYDESFMMYVVVGQPAVLKFIMSEKLHEEISRSLFWFALCLLGGTLVCFLTFLYFFERRL